MSSRVTIKMKTPKGESKQTLLGDWVDGEEYVKHLMSFECYSEKLGYEADLEAASKVTLIAYQSLKNFVKLQPGGENISSKSRKTNKSRGCERRA
jgi:hypothetical protein